MPGIDLQVEGPPRQMKRLLFFAALLAGNLFAEISAPKNLRIVTGEPSPTPTPGDPQDIDLTGYTLVFEENFDVLSVAETDAKGDETWYAYPPFGPAGAFSSSHFVPEAMQCIDGVLVNTASWNPARRDPLYRNWESGCLASMDKTRSGFAQRYGYWSARVKMPDTGWSAWAAFWLASASGIPNGGSKGYEIDIFEWYGDFKTHVGHSVHPWNEDGSQGAGDGGGFGPIPGGDATNAWHIYGCRVDPQWITFYVDGFESKRFPTNNEYLAEPLYIIIDYALRGNPVSGDKFDTKEPSHMLVDWVRAYELPAEEPVPPPVAPISLVTNPGFDDDNEDTQTPQGWEEWSDMGSNPMGFTRQGNSYSGARYYVMESDGPFRLFLSQVCPTEEPGLYTLRAQVMSFGGLNNAAMIVKDYGGPNLDVAIPTSKTWTQITIPNIRCDGPSARVGFWADTNGGNWIAVDDVEFFKQE
jgi:beta-glucanase (GH16 family)